MKYWLIKSEPHKYPIAQLQEEGSTFWDGVRNYQARLNLLAMKKGDLCLYYHRNEGKAIVGLARVLREAYADHTADPAENWVMVDVGFEEHFSRYLSLAELKAHPLLSGMAVVKNSRLSVCPVSDAEFNEVIKLTHLQDG